MATGKRVYDEFHPIPQWKQTEDCETLSLHLPKYQKNNLRIVVTPQQLLRITGERQEQGNRWAKFEEQYSVPPNTKYEQINAKFENEILMINFPKNVPQKVEKEHRDGEKQATEPALPQKDDKPAGTGDREAKKDEDLPEKAAGTANRLAKKAADVAENADFEVTGWKVLERYYKQGTGNLVKEMRRPEMLVMLGAGVLLVMALCLCMKNVISSCECK